MRHDKLTQFASDLGCQIGRKAAAAIGINQ